MLSEAAEIAARAGIALLVETEEGFWADTGARSAALVERVGNPSLGINWDPANALIEGDVPFPEGYDAVRRHVRNVHFKDARRYPDGNWELLAEGDVEYHLVDTARPPSEVLLGFLNGAWRNKGRR